MIMPRRSDQLLLPVNPVFIWFTLLAGACCSTCCRWAAWPGACPTCWRWRWCSGTCTSRAASASVRPSCFGLLMDVHQGALLGQHALAYTLLSFARHHHPPPAAVVQRWRRRRCRCCRCSCCRAWRRCCWCAAGGGRQLPGLVLLLAPVARGRCCGRWLSLLSAGASSAAPEPDTNRPL